MTLTTSAKVRTESKAEDSDSPSLVRRMLGSATPYAFIGPFYVLYLLFMVVPVGAAVYLSTTRWVGLGQPVFVGLANYRGLAGDQSFRIAIANSGFYVLVSVFVSVPLALAIAQGLNARGLRGRDLFRIAYFVPMVISPIVIALVFGLLLDTKYGLVNATLHALFGGPQVAWLETPTTAKLSLGLVLVWRNVGYLSIFFLAALQAVPRELYDAAELDGAGRLRTFTTVTLPSIRPVTAFVAVVAFINGAQLFDEPFLLTQGGPGEATVSVAMFVYRAAFERQQFGYAAAAGVVLFVIVFTISQLLSRLFSVGKS